MQLLFHASHNAMLRFKKCIVGVLHKRTAQLVGKESTSDENDRKHDEPENTHHRTVPRMRNEDEEDCRGQSC